MTVHVRSFHNMSIGLKRCHSWDSNTSIITTAPTCNNSHHQPSSRCQRSKRAKTQKKKKKSSSQYRIVPHQEANSPNLISQCGKAAASDSDPDSVLSFGHFLDTASSSRCCYYDDDCDSLYVVDIIGLQHPELQTLELACDKLSADEWNQILSAATTHQDKPSSSPSPTVKRLRVVQQLSLCDDDKDNGNETEAFVVEGIFDTFRQLLPRTSQLESIDFRIHDCGTAEEWNIEWSLPEGLRVNLVYIIATT